MVLITGTIIAIVGTAIITFGGGYLLDKLSNVLHGDEKSEADIVQTLAQENPAILNDYYEYKSQQQAGFGLGDLTSMLPWLMIGIVGVMILK